MIKRHSHPQFGTKFWLIAIALLIFVGQVNGQTPKYAALVIGNSKYDAGPLKNPSNDADALSATLTELGFAVTKLKDVTKPEFERAVDKVTEGLASGDLCLIFFAGHGIQMDGENYLVPVRTEVTQPQHVKERCVKVSYLLSSLDFSDCSLKLVVVDACRNNPFRSFRRSTSGFAKLERAPEGTIVAFSTSPNTTALDGKGDNSPFAKHLIGGMRNKSDKVEIVRLFREVSQAVRKETGQSPYLEFDAAMPDYFIRTKSTGSMKTESSGSASPSPVMKSADDPVYVVSARNRIILVNKSSEWPLHYRVYGIGLSGDGNDPKLFFGDAVFGTKTAWDRRQLPPGKAAALTFTADADALEIFVDESVGWKEIAFRKDEETTVEFSPDGKSWTSMKTKFDRTKWDALNQVELGPNPKTVIVKNQSADQTFHYRVRGKYTVYGYQILDLLERNAYRQLKVGPGQARAVRLSGPSDTLEFYLDDAREWQKLPFQQDEEATLEFSLDGGSWTYKKTKLDQAIWDELRHVSSSFE